MGAAMSRGDDEQQRRNLEEILSGRGMYGDQFSKKVAECLTYPHMKARETTEPEYAEAYDLLEDGQRESLNNLREALRKLGDRSQVPVPFVPRRELLRDGKVVRYVDTVSGATYGKPPNDFIHPFIDLGAPMNSDLQALASACGKAFERVFYEPLLWEAFEAYTGRGKERLVEQLGNEKAMRKLVAQWQIFRRRFANESMIHADSKAIPGNFLRNQRKRQKVLLIPWPRPVRRDFQRRPLVQPVHHSAVIKSPKRETTPSTRRCPRNCGVEVVILVDVHAGRPVYVGAQSCAHAWVSAERLPRPPRNTFLGALRRARADRVEHGLRLTT